MQFFRNNTLTSKIAKIPRSVDTASDQRVVLRWAADHLVRRMAGECEGRTDLQSDFLIKRVYKISKPFLNSHKFSGQITRGTVDPKNQRTNHVTKKAPKKWDLGTVLVRCPAIWCAIGQFSEHCHVKTLLIVPVFRMIASVLQFRDRHAWFGATPIAQSALVRNSN